VYLLTVVSGGGYIDKISIAGNCHRRNDQQHSKNADKNTITLKQLNQIIASLLFRVLEPVFTDGTAEAAKDFFARQGKFLQKSLVYFKKI